MFTHLLVPLDGSQFAEAALPYAQTLAGQFDAEITLLRVVQPPRVGSGSLTPETADFVVQLRDELHGEAETYLKAQRDALRQQGYKAHYRLVEGEQVAEEIIRVAAEEASDTVVMSTHGRSGLQRWVFGSVADKVLRQARFPILLIRAQEQAAPNWQVGDPSDALSG